MKKVFFILLCAITFICCCCKKSTSENADDTSNRANLSLENINKSKDSAEYSKLFKRQTPEDAFNQNKPQYTKYKNQIDVSDYKQFVRIDNLLRRKGLNICQLNLAIDTIAEKARRQSKEKYPDYYVGQIELGNQLQTKWRKAYLRKHNITENDAILITMLFTQYSKLSLCN